MANPTGLEKITENGQSGWRLIGRDPQYFGDIGNEAIDLSYSDQIADPITGVTEKGALGEYSIAVGRNVRVTGVSSFVIGDSLTNEGNFSGVIGINNKNSSIGSFVVGSNNENQGDNSFVGGVNSKVENNYSSNTFKTGSNSLAFGDSIIVDNPNSVSFGRFNLNDGTDNSGLYKIFTIGIGTSDIDRKNAFEVYDGSGIEYGSVKAPYLEQATIDADITGKVLITKEYLESKYNHAFDDAPIDGFTYGRKNKGWVRVTEQAVTQNFFKGTLPPPTDLIVPDGSGRVFTPGDVYLQYDIPPFITDGNINLVDGTQGQYDGNTYNYP